MIRKIIHIDEEKCNGCGACASACHEGAIGMVEGKARLLRDDYCDGFGDCLPACPTGAITFTVREAAAYDEAAVKAAQAQKAAANAETEKPETAGGAPLHATPDGGNAPAPATAKAPAMQGGCPGQRLRRLGGDTAGDGAAGGHAESAVGNAATPGFSGFAPSRLGQWPCQIKLVPTNAPYFAGAKLLIAADCTAYAYARMHEDFMRGKITLIGCPKLDAVDYTAKLTEIIRENDIRSLTVVRMEVPCCGGLEAAAKTALRASGKFIPWQVVTVSVDGHLID